jgi:hypothetical protein
MISDKEKLNLIQKNYKDLVLKYNILDKNYKELCKEALEQPLTRDWKHTIDERIARDSEFKEALEQPAWQGLTDKEDNAIIKKIWIWGNDFPYEKYRIAIEQALKDKNSV